MTTAIGRAGGIGAIDIVSVSRDHIIRDITVNTVSSEHGNAIVAQPWRQSTASMLHVSDRTFLMHIGGKIEVISKLPLKTRADLSMLTHGRGARLRKRFIRIRRPSPNN